MLPIFRFFTYATELIVGTIIGVLRFFHERVLFNPSLGPLRFVFVAAVAYGVAAVFLVYAVAPARGLIGQHYLGEKLRYDAQRWLATALYDSSDGFVGTFDARLDSQRDVNYTDTAIELGSYTAHPDHKSIPVKQVPPFYWQCLVYHEDRYIGTAINPAGIDLLGVLKIPISAVERTIKRGKPSLGMGGSTLPMQFVRVIYNTPPSSNESGMEKLRRKLSEWWLAPVVYRELTRDGDNSGLKQWAANHLWLAQRTGGAPLHGVEVTSRVIFGKASSELSIAEQFVLASAVNKPIILLEGSERLNRVRLDRWRYITEVRARVCADQLLSNEAKKKEVLFELVDMAHGPPDPIVRPHLSSALDRFAPGQARRAEANPVVRANVLLPQARFGIREEMKEIYGFGWRNYIRGASTTLDVRKNLGFNQRIRKRLTELDKANQSKLTAGFTLDPARRGPDFKTPDIVVVAANRRGEIIRYYDSGETAAYFGSPAARDVKTGYYLDTKEPRMIASTGKIISAIAIANSGRDTTNSLYLDTTSPKYGLETCRRGEERHGRKALVAFACSLNAPLLARTARAGQRRIAKLIDGLGFNMPRANENGEGTPPSTAAVLGQISGSPRRVHHMAAVVLAALTGQRSAKVPEPTLVKSFDFTTPKHKAAYSTFPKRTVEPRTLINHRAAPLLRKLLSAPLCYKKNGRSIGTLKFLSRWCADRHRRIKTHFAKTGTQVTLDPDSTVDVWIAGGLQFANGARYSYVVMAGTGNPNDPWARKLHASDVAAPLLDVLLEDLFSGGRVTAKQKGARSG